MLLWAPLSVEGQHPKEALCGRGGANGRVKHACQAQRDAGDGGSLHTHTHQAQKKTIKRQQHQGGEGMWLDAVNKRLAEIEQVQNEYISVRSICKADDNVGGLLR